MSDVNVTLIDGDLNRHVLACPGGPYFLARNSGVWGVSPVRIETERVAGIDGATLKQVSRDPATLIVPVRIGGPGEELTAGEQQTLMNELLDSLRPELECRIQVDRPGVMREITARYQAGARSDQARRLDLLRPTQVVELEFLALEPVWRNVEEPVSRYGSETFDNGAGGGINELVINVTASLPVWPRFILEGQVQNVEAMNATTGRMWRMVEQMTNQTDSMIVQTDPRAGVGAYLNNGELSWFFDAYSRLEDWQLVPGENRIYMRGVSTGLGASGQFSIEWIDLYGQC